MVTAGARTIAPDPPAIAPRGPSFTTTRPARIARLRTAASTSEVRAIRVASIAFGRKMSVFARTSSNPPSHASLGSQFGSIEVVPPASCTRSKMSGRSGRSAVWRKYELTCTCRADASSSGSIAAAVNAPIVPGTVNMPRSSGCDSTTVSPVGRSGSVTTPRTSTPRWVSSSRR